MVDERSTVDGTLEGFSLPARGDRDAGDVLALVVAWSRKEPHRIGQVAIVDEELVLGRGAAKPDDRRRRAELVQQRPGENTAADPIESQRISRAQLLLRPIGDRLAVESIGLCPMLLDGAPARQGEVGLGSTIHLQNEILFVVTRRSRRMPPVRPGPHREPFAFGEADASGFVGESPAAWRLRDEIAFIAAAEGHALILGESGTGKELVAGAIHRLSSRAGRPLVARNAATFPEGLLDAELFGNVKNYPNPGTPEREGLIGEADSSSLFLDEIGELPERLQAHLLRVLDRRGEYHRLGESRARRADVRVIGATNRPVEQLKHDLAARFTLRVAIPPLAARREDVPLLIRHLMRRAASGNAHVATAFFEPGPGGEPTPRLAPELVDRLVRHDYRLHTRELEQILWQALTESHDARVELTDGVVRRLSSTPPEPAHAKPASRAPAELDRSAIEAALARTNGNVTQAARELGLPNRYVLYRLMRKLGVSPDAADQEAPE